MKSFFRLSISVVLLSISYAAAKQANAEDFVGVWFAVLSLLFGGAGFVATAHAIGDLWEYIKAISK